MRRLALASVFAMSLLQLLAISAAAGPEWCDDGSPPPNDFRLTPTGTGSAGSSTSWLKSTDSGTLTFSPYSNTLVGGVAHGMTQALAEQLKKLDKGQKKR